ncbi:protein bicaudal C homolog 1-like isoform X1 [Pomacea canaliculata]|uniref:protein bicaudal C homolog 1-like isoform X1 n=1 Tax=Pomacea canaliculata TaxID=400727 RepID=UPI000D7275A9|nr:protein bicaudal C homolog 1-like isoform X1 [Pomacea canaliculata]
MAAGSGVRAPTMRETLYKSENGVDDFDTASQESRDESVEREPGFVEDRFRVDRKKLEQMLQLVPGDAHEENAEDFFQRVMEETSTQITWPSKLKIGAKSKKDPHIKVVGFPEDVKAARSKIMSILDTKSNRVTLKMDVSHTEHSHVIGKGGNNIKKVMLDTGCHIHFPDSNRGINVQEKSNQVSIAGQPAGVEAARAQIRDLLPLVLMFELPVTGLLQALPDVTSPCIQQLQQMYNVTITFKQRPRMYVTTVVVRGSVIHAKAVKEAAGRIMEQFTGSANHPVSMQLEIAPQHHMFIIGRGGINIKQIMQRTNSSILFPDPSTATPQRRGTVYITGSIESVSLARQQLIGCLPLVLMFDVKEDVELDQGHISQLMEQLDVYISVKPKPKQPSKSVIVKSIERNASNMYLARLLLLGLRPEGSSSGTVKTVSNGIFASQSSSGLGLSTLGFLGQSLLSVNTASSLLLVPGRHSPALGSPQACTSPNPNQWLQNPGFFAPVMVMGPASSCSLQTFDSVPPCNGFQKDFCVSSLVQVPTVHSKGPSSKTSEVTSAGPSPCSSPTPIGHRHQATVDLSALQSVGTIDDVITRDTSSLSSSGHTLDLLGLSKTTSVQQQSSLFTGLPSRLQNGEKSSESSGTDSDTLDKLGQGREHKNSSSSLFNSPLPFPFDYEQKKLLAMKAMQKKPEGESRIPTDIWAGLGFSKSMPESAIREKLGQMGISARYPDASMTPEEYQTQQELDLSIDRDPWKDSKPCGHTPPLNRAPGEFPSPRKKYEYGRSPCIPAENSIGKTDLVEVFSDLGLGKYTDLFQQQEIDLATFLTLTDQDLRELGISTFGARRKMLLAIADMNKQRTLQQAQPSLSTPTSSTNTSNNPFQANGATSIMNPRRPDLASLSGRW